MECYFLILNLIYCILIRLNLVLWSIKKWIDELENRRAINKIKEKLLAKKRKQDLEKAALQELMDEGEIFPEANKRPPIPKEVVDVVWRRNGGKCVYCGSTENLQLDHIIPFPKVVRLQWRIFNYYVKNVICKNQIK